MPSSLHEILIELVEVAPGLLPDLLRRTSGKPLPDFVGVLGGSEAATIKIPVEHRADAVRVFTNADNESVLATVVEVQLRPEDTKPWVWPVYVTEARRMHKCPAVLLVIVPDHKTATWARKPLDLGLGCSFVTPLVVDVSHIEPVTDTRTAVRDLGRAMLAALNENVPTKSLDALSAAMAQHAIDEAKQYAGLMLSALRGPAQDYWRKLMTAGTFAYQNDYARELEDKGEKRGIVKGIVKGEAKAIFRILNHRGIAIPVAARERIEGCTDSSVLEMWLDRALEATTIDDVLGELDS